MASNASLHGVHDVCQTHVKTEIVLFRNTLCNFQVYKDQNDFAGLLNLKALKFEEKIPVLLRNFQEAWKHQQVLAVIIYINQRPVTNVKDSFCALNRQNMHICCFKIMAFIIKRNSGASFEFIILCCYFHLGFVKCLHLYLNNTKWSS